jgi:hypothetical protein
MKTKYPPPFRGGVPGDDYFIRFKRAHELSLKKPQNIEACSSKGVVI